MTRPFVYIYYIHILVDAVYLLLRKIEKLSAASFVIKLCTKQCESIYVNALYSIIIFRCMMRLMLQKNS
ncbi:hypothetical protein BDB00DRAFT_794416 [Zychaea mexicana]|uniref:uncharacterized protein n=1 Tax=Zychaea mexicana TaxID=64656 RepID=UPI0022FF2D45|nr:uncharacterized protein BDB00DRAFT_794416 [Zychaea mexicana]KAI9499547.1 hypothetical protein BDB00DRAFT_794416 [Zychaea mexicana]